MGTINVGGNYFQFVGADASNNVIKASDGKYYQKGENGKYRILENGESIFNAIQQEATQDYNKSNGFVQNKKYYVEGNSSYYTMVDKNYNTVYYKDNQQITKEQFLKDANCAYDTKSKKYVAENLNENSHRYEQKYRRTVPDSKSGRYYVVVKGGKKLYFEKNGQQISERAFLDTEEACLDKNGNVVKYDWKMKVSKAFDGVCDMAKDMVSEAKPIPKRNEKGSIMIDENGQIVYEKNKDGSVKTKREFSLGRTCTTIVVGVGIVVAAPVVASAATVLGASAAISAGLATATNVAIGATFVGLGAKQMADANERNKDVTLSNNERLENWEQKGQGAAQVGMGLLMGGKSIKDAPKAYAKAKATANAIEVRNNATMASKGKISVTEKFANRCKGLKDATSASMSLTKTAQDTYRSTKNYVKKNSAKQIAKDIVKAPLKGVKNAVTDTYNTVRHPIRTAKNWAEGFKAGKSEASGALTPEQQKIKTDAQVKFNEVLPKENQARIAKYESLIENTTDKAQNAGLLETIKADNTLSPNEKSGILRKFFEKNQDQYPEVVSQIKTNDAETALKEAKSTQDLAKIDKEALTEKSQKRYEEQQSYFKEQEAKSFAKFGRMIEKSDDMSQVRAELSNNPEFDRLSPAQKNEIIGKINQREATLDSGTTPAKKPSYTQRAKNWVNKTVDNIKTKWNNRATAKTIAKFEKMIEESNDMSQVRAKLSNNPAFDKLSQAQKNELIGKINQRDAMLNAKKSLAENDIIPKIYEDFTQMIEKSNDMSQVRAKLSNNPAFDKLSQAQKNELIGRINQRDAMLENQKAMAENKPASPENNQTTAPTKKGTQRTNPLNALKAGIIGTVAQDHKVNTDTDDYMINHPEESYQKAVPENIVKPAVVAQETEDLDETEDIDTNEDTEVEDDVTTPEETEAPEEAGTEPEAPQATPEETNTTEEPEAESETPKTTTEKTAQNDTTSPDENNTKANDASAPSESSRVTTDKTSPDKETVKSNSELETTDTEPDIPAEQKRDITKRVLQANSDDEIADALTELREVGRFKGRKNLRRLLKAKRRNNQKRADKYKQRVLDNQEQINEAYKEKYKKKFEA